MFRLRSIKPLKSKLHTFSIKKQDVLSGIFRFQIVSTFIQNPGPIKIKYLMKNTMKVIATAVGCHEI